MHRTLVKVQYIADSKLVVTLSLLATFQTTPLVGEARSPSPLLVIAAPSPEKGTEFAKHAGTAVERAREAPSAHPDPQTAATSVAWQPPAKPWLVNSAVNEMPNCCTSPTMPFAGKVTRLQGNRGRTHHRQTLRKKTSSGQKPATRGNNFSLMQEPAALA